MENNIEANNNDASLSLNLTEKSVISLPGTPQEVALLLKDECTTEEVTSTIRKFSGDALFVGRPLDSLQIILAGYSGSGKSSTINFLFDDPALCQTNSLKSETRDPILVQKRLVGSQTKGPSVEGTISLVDLPGNFDTDNRREVCNLASVRKFLDSMFASRDGVSIPCLETPAGRKIRSTVYPNLVLFTLKATDNRLEGNSTNLRKALILLQKTGNLVDPHHPNLIILITHVCSLGLHATYFTEDLNEKKAIIRRVVKEVLGISDVDIVPIENRPERYALQKIGDYYKLPNEELSHYNLYQAMIKRLEKNNDHIGQLFANWYFQSSCPEKQTPAEAVSPTLDVDYSDLAKAASELHMLQKGTDPINPVTLFKFEALGHGYCPATEKLKQSIIPRREAEDLRNMKQIEIKGRKLMIPKYVSEAIAESSKFQRLTFVGKNEYQEHMKKEYGIDENFNLNMITGSEGKWMNDSFDRWGLRKLSFSQEIQVCSLRLVVPDGILKSSAVYKELRGLPIECKSEETAKKFLTFFAKWGTHVIHEVKLGGCFQFNCSVNAGLSQDKVKLIEEAVQQIFTKLLDHSLSPISEIANLKQVGVIQESLSLEIYGGNAPEQLELENVTAHDVEKWRNSICEKPSELLKSIKLISYYELLGEKDPLYKTLLEATKRYMEEPGSSCFPKGTQVYLNSGGSIEIEKLASCEANLQTLKIISGSSSGNSLQMGSLTETAFCTFLDKRSCDFMDYLLFQFSNGKTLAVSPDHLIFQFVPASGDLAAKKASCFQVGDMAVFMDPSRKIEYPVLQTIKTEKFVGAYSPLTMTGTFFADGFLVTSYADIESFALAQAALLPLKLWSKFTESQKQHKLSQGQDGIHPYAKFLMSVRKLVASHFTPTKN